MTGQSLVVAAARILEVGQPRSRQRQRSAPASGTARSSQLAPCRLTIAARGTGPPAGLVLVAPAPPDAVPVAPDRRAAMLAFYNTRDGVEQAIAMLAGRELDDDEREQVIADTLAGTPGAKREWTKRGMIAAVGPRLRDYTGPVRVVVGELDRVERPDALRAVFATVLPQATVETVARAGPLSPIEVPGTIASHCRNIGLILRTR